MILANHGIVSSSGGSVPLLLDIYSGASAAYSLRKLNTAYTGYAIRVRRSSDNTSQDIGFVNGELDTTSISNFVGANSGYVSIWYDQSGNQKIGTQVSLVNHPYIVINGTLQTFNGKPSLFFDGASRYLDCGYLNGGTKPTNYSTWISANFTDLNSTRCILGSGNNSGEGRTTYNQFSISSSQSYKMFGCSGDNTNYRYWLTANSASLSSSYLFEQHYKSNTSPYLGKFYWNNTLQTVSDWLGGTAQQNSGTEFKTTIGRGGEFDGNYHLGYLQEITTYFSDQISNRTGISTNINSFYTIY